MIGIVLRIGVMLRYDFTEDKHKEVCEQLQARKTIESSEEGQDEMAGDPLLVLRGRLATFLPQVILIAWTRARAVYYENAALSGYVAIFMFWGELHFPLMAAYYENAALSGYVAIFMFWGELHFLLMAA